MAKITTILIGALLLANSAMAADEFDLSELASLPILHEGRVKPLDTFARASLLRINSKSTHGRKPKMSAMQWLARALFIPMETRDDKVFRINSPEVADAMGIEVEERFRYSFNSMHGGLEKLHEAATGAFEKEDDERTPMEKELIRVYQNVLGYLSLVDSLGFATAHPDFSVTDEAARELLGMSDGQESFSYIELQAHGPTIAQHMGSLDTGDTAKWTPTQYQLFALAQGLFRWGQRLTQDMSSLKLVPPPAGEGDAWSSPGIILAQRDPEMQKQFVNPLVRARGAYIAGNQAEFDSAIRELKANTSKRYAEDAHFPKVIGAELTYNKQDPFYRSKIFYLLSLIALAVSALIFRKPLYWVGFGCLAIGTIYHLTGMGMRMYITSRPPITNLFETFIFVGAIGALCGFLLERFNRQSLGLIVGGISALSMMMISGKFANEGDTMGVLQAVLDSNFWLATHVIAINLGYAGCVIAGVIGHIYLVQRLIKGPDNDGVTQTYKMVFGVLAFGLIFTFVGTVLGGIWADQSWGRFWGWDPKENGALLIVLWCAILFHAKLGRMIGPIGVAAGSVFGIIVVMMAWFGINLLGVGLHSYGFTSGVLKGLIIYCVIELVFLEIVPIIKWRERRKTVEA
jgi:ABC-type transport system involved in cytochrome c biogenesis permease subunit